MSSITGLTARIHTPAGEEAATETNKPPKEEGQSKSGQSNLLTAEPGGNASKRIKSLAANPHQAALQPARAASVKVKPTPQGSTTKQAGGQARDQKIASIANWITNPATSIDAIEAEVKKGLRSSPTEFWNMMADS